MSEEDQESIYNYVVELSKLIVEGVDKETSYNDIKEYLKKRKENIKHTETSLEYYLLFPKSGTRSLLKSSIKEDAIEEAREFLRAGREEQAIFFELTKGATKSEGFFVDSGRAFYSPKLKIRIFADGTMLPTAYLDIQKEN